MKKYIYFLSVSIIVISTLISCKKDSDDKKATKNYLKIDGVEYDLSKGFIVNYGYFGTSNNLDLILISPGITIHEIMGLPDSVSGTGNAVYFEIYSSSSDKLAVGDYTYNDSGDAGTFDWADYILNWNATQQPYADFTSLTSCSLKVLASGSEYELSFSGKDDNDKEISGYYKGILKYYNDSGKKKSQKLLFSSYQYHD